MAKGFRDVIQFLQLFGTTVFDANGQPTARTSTTVVGINSQSIAWSMVDTSMISIEMDATNRGGGALNTVYLFERASLPAAARFPLAAGVIWVPVPTAEMAFAPVISPLVQIQEFTLLAAPAYRINNPTTHNVNGDLWAGMNTRRL